MVIALSGKAPAERSKAPIRVLLADDHPVTLKGIAVCLAQHKGLDVVGEAADGLEALQKAKLLLPDVVLADMQMPRLNGPALTDRFRRELPQVKVLVLSMHSTPSEIRLIMQTGVRGYVLKSAPIEDLIKAIETVQAGQTFFSPEVARIALNQFVRGTPLAPGNSNLTPREREVLTWIAEGLSSKEIANCLGVGVRTVETHRERLMRKLNIHSIAGLTKFALVNGLAAIPKD
jgi:DNA-binding NarL/FixJ family response regulator